jgi:hypothetical protein
MAAATTMIGLISTVRPVCEPWRPLKLRFEELAQRLVADELVGIHRKAHGATRAAPFEAGLGEDLVEAFVDGLDGGELGTWDDDGLARSG